MDKIIIPKTITKENFSKFGDMITTKNIKPLDINNGYAKRYDDIAKINKLSLEAGKTKVIIDVEVDKKRMSFQLNEKRKIDLKMLNLMRNEENIDVL